jgi:hypothetical protein
MSNFIIKDMDKVKSKLDLISNLVDMKTVFSDKKASEAKTPKKTDLQPNQVDSQYDSLNCDISPLEATDADYKTIDEYL